MSITILITLLASALVFVFLFGLGSSLVPLVLSFVLAFFLFPLVTRLEKWGVGRTWATVIVFLGATLLFVLAFVFTIPPFVREARFFLNELPVNLQKVITKAELLAAEYGVVLDFNKEQIISLIKKYSSTVSLELVQGIGAFFKEAFTELTGLFLFILNLFLFPVFFYYAITDLEDYGNKLKELIPHKWRNPLKNYYSKVNSIFKSYFRGQFLVAITLAVFYGVALSFTSLKFGLVIGIMTGLLGVIPYIGFTIGFGSALIFSLAHFPGLAPFIMILVIFGVGQLLEGFVLTPKLVGKSLGLNPLLTMLALIVGGNYAGLIGMIFALPLVGSIKILLENSLDEYKKSKFYLGKA